MVTDSIRASTSNCSPPGLETSAPCRVLIVEDQREVFEAASRLLDAAGYDVCEQVATGESAATAVSRMQPDLVLMDIQLGGDCDGIAAASEIRKAGYDGPLVYFTAHADDASLARAHATRPEAFLLKPVAPRQLLATVELVLARAAEDRQVRHHLRRAREALTHLWEVTDARLGSDRLVPEGEGPQQAALRRLLDRLSNREREVFVRAVRGEALEGIARELFISPHTARNHMAAIYRKLRVNSRLELSTTYLAVAGPAEERD